MQTRRYWTSGGSRPALAENDLSGWIDGLAAEDRRFRDMAGRLYDAEFRLARLQGAIGPSVNIIGAGAVLRLLGWAGALVVKEGIGAGALVSLFLYGLVLVGPIGQVANVYGATQSARAAAQRLMKAMSAPAEIDAGTRDHLPCEGDIEYRDIDFDYPGRRPLLQGFDLRIAAGETVAITGPNGAGKSTLVHLLLRLLEPGAGSVRIDGIDVRASRLAALREGMGLVSQQVLLFNASVTDNIAYGRTDATTPAQIEAAARASRAHDFVAALQQGYATVVGEQGVPVSSGQKQRIALARALLKDPAILILDEATPMVDPEGEAEFMAECHEVLQQRMVILISHRPAGLALADRVLRLDGGCLATVKDSPPAYLPPSQAAT